MVLVRFSAPNFSNNVSEGAGTLSHTLTLSQPSTQPVSVTVRGPSYAAGDLDVSDKVVTFAPGQTTATFTTAVYEDTLYEGDEVFRFELVSAVGAQIDLSTTDARSFYGYVLDNDLPSQPTVRFSAPNFSNNVSEGAGTLSHTLTLSQPSTQPVSVTVRGPSYAAGDLDVSDKVVTFAPGQTTATFTTAVYEDTLYEGDEVFRFELVSAVGAQIDLSTTDARSFYGYVLDNDLAVVAQPLPDQSSPEDQAWSFQVPANTFWDVDGDTLTYCASLSNGSALPSWLTFNAATRTFSGTPPLNFNGALDLKVTASDGSASASDTFKLTITPTNDAPVVVNALADHASAEDQAWSFQVSASAFSDLDGDALTYSASLGDGSAFPSWVSFNAATRSFSGTPWLNFNGSLDLKVTASDGSLSASDTFKLTITPVNDAPLVVNALADHSSVEGQAWTLQIPANGFADADGDALTYSASLSDGSALPGWMTFNAATRTFFGTPPLNFNGALDLKVTASDGSASASDTFTLTITPTNDAPVASPVVLPSGLEDTPVTITAPQLLAGAFDVDGDWLTVSSLSITDGGGAMLDNSNGTWTYTPQANYTGPVSFTYIVSDGERSTSSTASLNLASGDDTAIGGDGNDHLDGGVGDDLVAGGLGNDRLEGGAGNDSLYGDGFGGGSPFGGGDDQLLGGEGDDFLFGDFGLDLLLGGDGSDRLEGGDGNDRFEGEDGNDTLLGDDGIDLLLAGAGDDQVYGGGGGDRLEGADGRDALAGQNGDDQMDGGSGDDWMYGGAGLDQMHGGDGTDLLVGDGGGDRLDGGAGNDQLYGYDGDDVLIGGSGNDAMNGGAGNDLFVFEPGFGQDQIFGFAAGAGSGDSIMLTGLGFNSFADVQARTTDAGAGAVITVDALNTITLFGVTKASLSADDFLLA